MPKKNYLTARRLIRVLTDLVDVYGDLPVMYINQADRCWDENILITKAYVVKKADIYEHGRPTDVICVDD